MTDEEFDPILLSQVTSRWTKVIRVIDKALNKIPSRPASVDSFYLMVRLKWLRACGLIESRDDEMRIRSSEVRLPKPRRDVSLR